MATVPGFDMKVGTDESIDAAMVLAQSREQRVKSGELDFETLAKEMGFSVRDNAVEVKMARAA